MAIDPEALFARLTHLHSSFPDFVKATPTSADLIWLGQVYAATAEVGLAEDAASIRRHTSGVRHTTPYQRQVSAAAIMAALSRAIAVAELAAPASVQGSFIPVGHSFDALAALQRVLSGAGNNVLVVDPYMDARFLTDFAPLAPEHVTLRLMADQRDVKPSLRPAATNWAAQNAARRPLEVRVAAPRTLHDRLIVVDGTVVWVLTQSFNALATRAPASILKAGDDIAAVKIPAYEAIWQSATPLP